MLNALDNFESLEDGHLKTLKAEADSLGPRTLSFFGLALFLGNLTHQRIDAATFIKILMAILTVSGVLLLIQ